MILACGLWVLVQWFGFAATLEVGSWVPRAEYGTLTDCMAARDQAAGGKQQYQWWRCVAKEQVK